MTKPLELFTRLKEAWDYVGGLSNPSKMPGWAYGIPADQCNVGSKLRKVEGSVCSNCYALKGNYVFDNVKDAQKRRIASMDKPYWVAAMAFLLKLKQKNARSNDAGYFRMFDSGDLQSYRHLLQYMSLVRSTPTVQHWMPTREVALIVRYVKDGHKVPDNLAIRISANMVGQRPITEHPVLKGVEGIQFSAVSLEGDDVSECPAYKQEGSCGDCRNCWSRAEHKIVSYKEH